MDPTVWEWVEGNGAYMVSEWGLIYDNKFKASIPAMLFFIICTLGAGILGTMADSSLGQKHTLILSCICSLVLSTESVGRKWGGQIGLYGFFFFAAGFVSLPGIAYITRSSWRNAYMLISTLSMAYCCIVLPFIWESPRWLTIRGRTDESLQVLRKMVFRNNKSNLPKNIGILRADEGSIGTSVTNLLRLPWTRRRMFVTLNGLMELPAIVLGSLLLPRVNRRLLVFASLTICGVYCILCIVFTKDNYSQSGTGNWLQGTNYMGRVLQWQWFSNHSWQVLPWLL
eukprot:Gb_28866 [translate_table: standard]